MGKPRFLTVAFLLLVLGAGVLYFVLHRPNAGGGEPRWPELTGSNVARVIVDTTLPHTRERAGICLDKGREVADMPEGAF